MKTPLAPPAPLGRPTEQCKVQSAECKVGLTPPASLGKPGGQTAPEALAPIPARMEAPAPKPARTETPIPKPARTEAPAPQPAPREAAAPVAPETVNVVFRVFQPRARRVSVCGEFNGWSPEANPMELQGEGRWQTVVALKPGQYQYKFVIDGEWMPDPEAKQNVFNPFGTLNSMVKAG